MKETILDVLMFLFENYLPDEFVDSSNQPALSEELTQAGFEAADVRRAFAWIDALAEQPQGSLKLGASNALRLYTAEETDKLSTECRGFLLYLEQLGLLDAEHRETVIERLMALKTSVDLERVKWVCLLVMLNQPDAEQAIGHLEEMVYCDGQFLH
ncbi:DUF494 family protein [Sinimarinibacterium sp. NLF-5-8]|uniref:DUF494 family protein n=1 Tax=Sinimarinibacterium sp. NLF-5-8 TaxID=2698684 RepID=UPI00137BE420|nr:DUF494 domain-containing protein [Sinimarinibacterium sp. NLF-5-8]QHS10640.1 DUF494 domain-containing protein [Sinimarinibacterium sp. NLF-5-8]